MDDMTDSISLHDSIIRISKENVQQSYNNTVVIEKKLLAQVIGDHFKFYDVLHRVLPIKAVNELNNGEQVIPEVYESVTIFFSDIVGFTEITSKVEPLLIVKLLNQLYSVMDYIATLFPIFKVETIGDSYMIVGGMNGTDDDKMHASNIADFALLVMQACELCKSPYDNSPIMLRTGIHSGSVAAGVVGTVMPRYCLFGNSVNTAHRMESTSEVSRIQCSKDTAQILEQFGTHNVEKRGMVDCKGLGSIETYWITSMTEEHAHSRSLRNMNVNDILHKCREILDSFEIANIARFPHLCEMDTIVVADDTTRLKTVASGDLLACGFQKLEKGEEVDDPVLSLLSYKGMIHKSVSISSFHILELESSASTPLVGSEYSTPITVLNTLIICDQSCIRLSTMYLLKDTFKIDNCVSVVSSATAAMKVLEDETRFDIIVLEKNLFMALDEGEKEILHFLITRKRRLSIMIVPDCDYKIDDASIDDPWYHEVLFPFPSPAQLNSTFHFSNDSFARMLSDLNEPRLPQVSTNKSVSILIVCSSKSVGKLMKKQMTTAVLELGAKCNVDNSATAFIALDKCCTGEIKAPYDIVMIDNALTVSDIQACELIELLRNQPPTSNSLIITLTKSVLTNTTALTDAGADIIWSKPLAEKELLKQKLARLCKNIFISTL